MMRYRQATHHPTKPLGLTILVVAFAICAVMFGLFETNVKASPVVGFQAGRIIDDTIFINKTSMTQVQIQQFLEAQVPVCDTNGTQTSEFGGGTRAQWAAALGYSPPFTCLRDFSEGGKSASQIIYDVAQEFSINPQVLIVLLQKEQGLITDTWPIPGSSQYRTATGYGCPDTAACDSQYFGLTNQLTWSGRMFRAIMNASPTWFTPYVIGNNYIQYNPNSSCGGSTVNIENRSTQALYNYTPYQPSQAALDAGWGQVNCGAYGNRNFYLYFTSWFGPTNKPAIPTCPVTAVNCVWEFYNLDTDKYFYTADLTERNSVYAENNLYIGVAFYSRKVASANTVPIYRIHNETTGAYLWVPAGGERTSLVNAGWLDQGVAFYMDHVTANTGAKVSRLYLASGTGIHRLSTNGNTIQSLVSTGYAREGSSYTAPTASGVEPSPSTGNLNVYRFLYKGRHFWTSNLAERIQLQSNPEFKYEGVGWESSISTLSRPVYRVYSPEGRHFWTTSLVEKNILVSNGWRDEGTGWREKAAGTDVHRYYNTLRGNHIFTSSNPERSQLNLPEWRYEGISWES
jgi:hypothetical protein